MKRIGAGLGTLLIAGCSLTETSPVVPPPIVKTTEQHVCVDSQAQVIECPSALNLPKGQVNADIKVSQSKQAQQQQAIREQLAQARNMTLDAPSNGSNDHVQTPSMVESDDFIMTQHSLSDSQHSVRVAEYIEQIADELVENVATDVGHAVVGVTSFVDFNNDLATLTPFGNRVAEHFYTSLFQQGFTVADYKVRSKVSVTPNGDFVFSRNVNKLDAASSMTHVLTGTVLYQKTGLLINARIVDFDTKWVVSTASGFIPYFVLDSIVPAAAKNVVL